jgi:urease accessory protein
MIMHRMDLPTTTDTVPARARMPDGAISADGTRGLLALGQWLSPGFPVGAFAYSHGLEWAIAAGEVATADELGAWIAAVLRFGAGRADSVMLAHALRPGADLAALAERALALAASAERARETLEQGAAFVAATNAVTGSERPDLPYPVAVGAAAGGLGLAPRIVLALYLQAFAANLVAAGVRFVPLGQTQGQVALAGLRPVIEAVAAEAADAPLEMIGTAAVGADLAAMRHETMDVRLFRT